MFIGELSQEQRLPLSGYWEQEMRKMGPIRGIVPTDNLQGKPVPSVFDHRRPWIVVQDPTEGNPFLGRQFRATDFKDGGGFATGTIFEHMQTGERRQVIGQDTETLE